MEAFEIRGKVDNEGNLITNEQLPIHNKTVRVILMIEEDKKERKTWIEASIARLSQAYSEKEHEYSVDMIKEPNPKYEKYGKG